VYSSLPPKRLLVDKNGGEKEKDFFGGASIFSQKIETYSITITF
jgi:hypothetical protein